MNKISKIFSVIISAVIAVTLTALPSAAVSLDNLCFEVPTGKELMFEYNITGDPFRDEQERYCKFETEEPGTLSIEVFHNIQSVSFMLYDPKGTIVKFGKKAKASMESDFGRTFLSETRGTFYRSNKFEKSEGRLTVDLKYSGTYYLAVTPGGDYPGQVFFTLDFPAEEEDCDEEIVNLKSVMKVGSSANLFSETVFYSGNYRWKSSDPSVVSIDSTGEVTALRRGKAKLTGETGSNTIVIIIKVV